MLKMLIEICRQKRIGFNVILAFLDHLKSKIFCVSQLWLPTQSAPAPSPPPPHPPHLLFKISASARFKNRSNHQSSFVKKDVLKNFAIFTWKHLCWSLFFIKLQAVRAATLLKSGSNTMFSCEYCEIIRNTYFVQHLRTAASLRILLNIHDGALGPFNNCVTLKLPFFDPPTPLPSRFITNDHKIPLKLRQA